MTELHLEEGELTEFYESYADSCRGLYDDLDMMSVLKRKETMTGYFPAGKYADFVNNNYQKIQKRVDKIRRSGEGDYGFYPGQVYRIHSIMYGKIGKRLLLEMAVLMALCILFLMDYESLHKTRGIVVATRTGKKSMKIKAAVGLISGLIYSVLLCGGTYACFFCNISFEGLWETPVASVILCEPRQQMLYPFVTFWRLTWGQYFMLSIVVAFLLLLVAGCMTIALYLILQNSYFTFLLQCLFYMGVYLLAFLCKTKTFLDVILAVFNPASLWITCGAWFMENDITLSFTGNEFWCVGCAGVVAVLLLFIGKMRYRRLEIV